MGNFGSMLASVWATAADSERVTLAVAGLTVAFAVFVSLLEFVQWVASMTWGSKELRMIENELERVWDFVNTRG
jgi:hypothetical protein